MEDSNTAPQTVSNAPLTGEALVIADNKKQAASLITASLRIKETPRNFFCPCGSKKKVKKCCLPDADSMLALGRRELEQAQQQEWELKQKPQLLGVAKSGPQIRRGSGMIGVIAMSALSMGLGAATLSLEPKRKW